MLVVKTFEFHIFHWYLSLNRCYCSDRFREEKKKRIEKELTSFLELEFLSVCVLNSFKFKSDAKFESIPSKSDCIDKYIFKSVVVFDHMWRWLHHIVIYLNGLEPYKGKYSECCLSLYKTTHSSKTVYSFWKQFQHIQLYSQIVMALFLNMCFHSSLWQVVKWEEWWREIDSSNVLFDVVLV